MPRTVRMASGWLGIGLDLAAQGGDAQVDGAVERFHLAVCHRFQQPVALQRPVGVFGKQPEQVELARRQRLLAAVVRIDQHALVQIEHPPLHTHARSGCHRRPCRAPQHALDPRQQLARLIVLGDVVIGPGFEADHVVDGVGCGRHHDDADASALLAQPPRESEAIFAGQPDIEQHQGRQLSPHQAAQRVAAVDATHAEVCLSR